MHGGHAGVPACYHVALAENEFERFVAVARTVEFGAFRAVLVQPAGVMHADRLAGLRLGAGADHLVMVLHPGLHRHVGVRSLHWLAQKQCSKKN